MEAEGVVVHPVKVRPHVVDGRGAGKAGRDRDQHLVAFADVADVGAAFELDRIARHALRRDLVAAPPLELGPQPIKLIDGCGRLLAHQRAHVVALDVADVQPEGGEVARIGR